MTKKKKNADERLCFTSLRVATTFPRSLVVSGQVPFCCKPSFKFTCGYSKAREYEINS